MIEETKLTVLKDGRPMALELNGEGDTDEDEELAHVVKVNLKKQRAKGKQRDFGQQSGRESLLQIIFVYQLTNFFSVVFSTSP